MVDDCSILRLSTGYTPIFIFIIRNNLIMNINNKKLEVLYMGLFFKKKKEVEPELEPMKILSVEELFANIDMLKEQFLAVKDDVEARDEKIAELEKALEQERVAKDNKDKEIVQLQNRVAQLEELLGEIDKLIDKK